MTAAGARRLAAAALLLLAAGPVAAEPAADLSVQIEATLDEFRDHYGFPGATVAIALPERDRGHGRDAVSPTSRRGDR